MRELGTVDDVADAVEWLASGEAAYITVNPWMIDGGMHHRARMQLSRNVDRSLQPRLP